MFSKKPAIRLHNKQPVLLSVADKPGRDEGLLPFLFPSSLHPYKTLKYPVPVRACMLLHVIRSWQHKSGRLSAQWGGPMLSLVTSWEFSSLVSLLHSFPSFLLYPSTLHSWKERRWNEKCKSVARKRTKGRCTPWLPRRKCSLPSYAFSQAGDWGLRWFYTDDR